jgi:hypothetical protein
MPRLSNLAGSSVMIPEPSGRFQGGAAVRLAADPAVQKSDAPHPPVRARSSVARSRNLQKAGVG